MSTNDTSVISRSDYFLISNVESAVADIPADSIVSRTVYLGETLRIILFGFAPGQELSEHTSNREVVLHFLRGEADLVLGEAPATAGPGTVVRLAPKLPHSVYARTETLMLLTMIGR